MEWIRLVQDRGKYEACVKDVIVSVEWSYAVALSLLIVG